MTNTKRELKMLAKSYDGKTSKRIGQKVKGLCRQISDLQAENRQLRNTRRRDDGDGQLKAKVAELRAENKSLRKQLGHLSKKPDAEQLREICGRNDCSDLCVFFSGFSGGRLESAGSNNILLAITSAIDAFLRQPPDEQFDHFEAFGFDMRVELVRLMEKLAFQGLGAELDLQDDDDDGDDDECEFDITAN